MGGLCMYMLVVRLIVGNGMEWNGRVFEFISIQ